MREGWTYKKLGEVCSFINDGDWIESKDQSESGIRLIQTGNIGNGEYKDKGERAKYISEDTFSKLDCTEIFKGDCLVSRLPEPIGRCCILPELENRCITAVDCSILRFKTDIIPQLFVYYSQSTKYAIDVENKTTGTTRKRISRKNLEGIQIPIPPKSQQVAIVSELDEINSLLALKREQLQKYDKLAQSLFYEMFGDPVKNEKGWEVKKVSDVCSVFGRIGFRGYTKADFVESPEEGAISLSPTNIINNSMDYKKCSYVTWDKYHESPEIKARIGDILLVKTGSSYGKCALITFLPHKATINPQFVIIKNITINNRYLHYYLSSEAAKICYDNFVIGTAVPTFSQKNLNNMAVLVPPLSLQQQFASRIEQIESQKQQVQAAIEKLETLLASRMQYWFE